MTSKSRLSNWEESWQTLIMLLAIGWIAGHNIQSRLSYALIAFGVWDIFYLPLVKRFHWLAKKFFVIPIYYFFNPLPWWGPVLSPCFNFAVDDHSRHGSAQ